jgi:hypothetical protein
MATQFAYAEQFGSTLAEQAEFLYRGLGVWEVMQHLEQIGRDVMTGHGLVRRIERAQVLQMDIGQVDRLATERSFALARRHASRARRLLDERMASEEGRRLAENVNSLRGSAELDAALQEGRERWAATLLASDIPGADAEEFMNMWTDTSAKFQADGLEGLFRQITDYLAEFDRILQPEEDWGRRPHSPLQWWEWLIIIAVVGFAIGALSYCLWIAGCSWIKAAFVAVCIVQGAGVAPGLCAGASYDP